MIRYVVVLDDDSLEDASVFQGLSPSMLDMEWALRSISEMPTDIFDFGLPLGARKARRIVGKGWSWTPLAISSFLELRVSPDDPYWVVYSGSATTFGALDDWESHQALPILHISTDDAGRLAPEKARWTHVRDQVRRVAAKLHEHAQQFPVAELRKTLKAWRKPTAGRLDLVAKPHNCTIPNLVTLRALGFSFSGEEPLKSPPGDERPHINAIAESANAVIAEQDTIGLFPALLSHYPRPDRIVIAPSLYAHARQRVRPSAEAPEGLFETIRVIQRQKGYTYSGPGPAMLPTMSPAGRYIMGLRARELNVQTLAVTLRAASTLAATVRLPNGVNLSSELSDFTGHVRGGRSTGGNNKAERVFRNVQNSLRKHTSQALLDVVASSKTGVKLVADAPLEWLPLEDLPLGIALDVSRIPATPGNLMMTQLMRSETLFLRPKAFEEVLVVSSFSPSDPIRNDVRVAMETFTKTAADRLDFRQVTVNSREQFVEAVNSFHGAMMIFDGHGSHERNSGAGFLHIGKEKVDIWELRGTLRPPPVVVLSACDTHSPDRTHATAGAGFLTCGATSVVGTFLPVRSKSAALFAARLSMRAAWYTHAVVHGSKRPILWSEVVGSMLRLDFLSDLIGRLEGKKLLSLQPAMDLRTEINMFVHTRDPDWWAKSKARLIQATGLDADQLARLISKTIAEGDCVRYTHLGNPELLCITDNDVLNAV
ncbi:hypothetical protein B5K08_31095 [Rhizobium leguminosarum bv. trifolii]|uniref:CHAT domain-containing protein n=2 Tax=Rhizobium leguminosarum TaxID=384 RepID=A0A3E1B029_RHILT|nr:hypothetical protein B5K10_31090 [Rhizobium leguminosarum bv. trifolii]RFB82662.1 hypothetical protein B5K08_31095 [Rhizobium leguminosarum bv. trifolii]